MPFLFESHYLRNQSYELALIKQSELYQAFSLGSICGVLFHEPRAVYTLGRRASFQDFLISTREIQDLGIEVLQTDRGGQVTYHGPGQVVGFPVLHLPRVYESAKAVRCFVHDLEESLILTLQDFEITGARLENAPGVYVDGKKIASIGIQVKNEGEISHGFSLNLGGDLDAFLNIHPCGMPGMQMTSIEKLKGFLPDWSLVCARIETHLKGLFSKRLSKGESSRFHS